MRNHKKLILLCNALRINRAQAIGHLHMLWWWAIEHRENGDLSGLFDKDIATACDWEGDSGELIKALHDTEWLKDYRITDWEDYSWRLLGGREKNRERQRKYRNTLRNALQTPLVTGATVPYHTILKDMFNRFYGKYPKKVGKEKAFKAFIKISPNDELLETILRAVESHSQSSDWKKDGGQFIPHPATWLNGRRWEDEVKSMANGNTFGKKNLVL